MTFSAVIYAGKNLAYDLNEKLLGLSLLERQILTAKSLGAKEVVVVKDEPVSLPEGNILFVNGAYFVHPIYTQEILNKGATLIEGSGLFAYLEREAFKDEIDFFVENGRFETAKTTAVGNGYRVLVDSPKKKKVLSKELFKAMRKPVDGLIARSINKAVSFFLTEYFWLPLKFSPNMITIITVIIGTFSGIVAAKGTYLAIILGTFLAQFASILDGCDGEVARLTFKTSTVGKWLDSIGDSIVNTSLMIGLGYGLEPYFGITPVIIGWTATGINWLHNFVSYFDVIVVRKTTDVFAFTWWFEKKDRVREIDLSKPVYGPIGKLDFLKYLSRRDFYLFAYFVLAVIGPTAMMVGYVTTAIFVIPSFFLTLAHIYFGIIKKM